LTRIVHLSDLHLGANDALQRPLFISLAQALRTYQADLLVFTGDIFDSSVLGPEVIDRFLALLEQIDEQVGPKVRTIILPGNHDRRASGIFWPHSTSLFDRLAERVKGRSHIQVLGCKSPFLAHLLELPEIPAHVVAYDSTYLPHGLFSAGGMLRQEDLLEVAERILDTSDDKPLLFLVHHHLVPTPITDVGEIDVHGRGPLVGFVVKQLLPSLVSNADREELTMTALGAGSALTTLHALGRAVMVLHGHKHYPTVRLLKGVRPEEGDVMLLAAGSCGTNEQWQPSIHTDAPRLWPSFNVLDLDGPKLHAQSVAFPPEVDSEVWTKKPRVNRRLLVDARRTGTRWDLEVQPAEPKSFEPSLTLNEATVTLVPSVHHFDRHDLETLRVVQCASGSHLGAHHEMVEGPAGARMVNVRINGQSVPDQKSPANLELPLDGTASYTLLGGVCSSLAEGSKHYGHVGSAFEWVGLLNRYRAQVARLVVKLSPIEVDRQRPFASVTDLTTGRERAVELKRDDANRTYAFELKQCPARTMLRVYWPLAPR
jgi:3',5'-cyclic AMP phosphodiesterase CpdA